MCTLFNVLAGMVTYFSGTTTPNVQDNIIHYDTYECTQELDRVPKVIDRPNKDSYHEEGQGVLEINKMSKDQMKPFRYTKLCEVFSNNNDEELLTWTPINIDKFLLRRRDPNDICKSCSIVKIQMIINLQVKNYG